MSIDKRDLKQSPPKAKIAAVPCGQTGLIITLNKYALDAIKQGKSSALKIANGQNEFTVLLMRDSEYERNVKRYAKTVEKSKKQQKQQVEDSKGLADSIVS